MIRTHHLLLACLCAAVLPAQTITLPANAAATEQGARLRLGETLPLTPTGKRLIQISYDQTELSGLPAQTWTTLVLRPDAGGIAQTTRVRVSVWLSAVNAPRPRDLSFFDRAANRGSDRVQVIQPRIVSLPRVAPRQDGRPQPGIALNFDTPYSWPAQSGLLIEIDWERIDPWQPGVQDFDAMRFDQLGWATNDRVVSPGCAPAGRFQFTANTTVRDEDLLLTAAFSGTGVDTSANALFAIAGLPVAIPLDPLGAPGCVLGIDPALLVTPLVYPTPGGGGFWTNFTLPYDPAMLGGRILGQAWLFKPGVNALGATLSETIETTVVQAPVERRAQVLFFTDLTGPATGFTNNLIPVVGLR